MKKHIATTLIGLAVLGLTGCGQSTPEAPPAAAKVEVTVPKWGPQGTKAGVGFSIQSTGNSAIWFEQRGISSAESVEVWFDKTKLGGMAIRPNEGGSAEVPPALLATPGKFPIYFVLKPSNQRVEIGTFEITP